MGDGYVSKLDASGSLVFSTLVGGRNTDNVRSVAIASNGDVVIGGTTNSDDVLTAAGVPGLDYESRFSLQRRGGCNWFHLFAR